MAISISGNNQVVKIINGVDNGSEENTSEKFKYFSSVCHKIGRLIRLTKKL